MSADYLLLIFGPEAALHRFDEMQPCWQRIGSSDPEILEQFLEQL